MDERAQTAQTDVNDRFAKAEASLVEAQVEILEAAAQQEKVVDGKFAEVESKRLEDAATTTAAQDALKTEFQEQLAASDAKSAAAQAAVDEKVTQLETVRQGDLQDAEEKRRLASEAVDAQFQAINEQQAASTTAREELSKRLADVETVAVLADETNAAQDERISSLATETDA